MLSSLHEIEVDLTPPDDLYVCPFCDKTSFRYQKREGEVFLACSSCGSNITLNDEVWKNPRRRIEILSLTSGYPGVYILRHLSVLYGKHDSQSAILDAESMEIEKAFHALSSPDENVRYRAARSLRIRHPPQAFGPVVAAFGSEPLAKIRVLLVQVLPSIGGTDAIPHLVTAMEDADPAVRKAVLHALSSFEGTDAREAVRRAAGEDPDVGVRTLAIHLLEKNSIKK